MPCTVSQNHALTGGDGDDLLAAGPGDDSEFYGGDGADKMFGGRGWDNLQGGNGADKMFGGPGGDGVLNGDRFTFRDTALPPPITNTAPPASLSPSSPRMLHAPLTAVLGRLEWQVAGAKIRSTPILVTTPSSTESDSASTATARMWSTRSSGS